MPTKLTAGFLPSHAPFLLPLTIALIVGIWWQSAGQSLYIAIPIILMVYYLWYNTTQKTRIGLLLLMFCAGASLHHHQQKSFDDFYSIYQKKTANLTGIVQNITKTDSRFYKYRLTLAVQKIIIPPAKSGESRKKTIELYWHRPPKCLVGDIVEIENISFKYPNNQSFKKYLIRSNIVATVFPKKPTLKTIHRPRYSIKRYLFNLRARIIKKLQKKLSFRTYPLFSTIFLGYKEGIKKNHQKNKIIFNTWGILHFLARSGLHLIIFLLLIEIILRLIPISYTTKQFLSLLLAISYFFCSWPSVSFTRALTTFILYKSYLIFNLPIQALYLVTLICFLTLLYNPTHLFFLDFQLSFGITMAIAWFGQIQSIKNRLLHQTVDKYKSHHLG